MNEIVMPFCSEFADYALWLFSSRAFTGEKPGGRADAQ